MQSSQKGPRPAARPEAPSKADEKEDAADEEEEGDEPEEEVPGALDSEEEGSERDDAGSESEDEDDKEVGVPVPRPPAGPQQGQPGFNAFALQHMRVSGLPHPKKKALDLLPAQRDHRAGVAGPPYAPQRDRSHDCGLPGLR